MTHPIPPGTRDILPDEMRELRALAGDARRASSSASATARSRRRRSSTTTCSPRGDDAGAPAAYRFFDERGELLAMRSDMTVPIARLVANRYADAEPPFRFFYNARAYRAVRPQRGQMREFFQAGRRADRRRAPQGTVEVIEVLSAALDAAGLGRAVIGLGDAALYRPAPRGAGSRRRRALARVLGLLAAHDLVGLSRPSSRHSASATPSATLLTPFPLCAAAPRCSTGPASSAGRPSSRAIGRLAETYEGVAERGIADRVSLDLGLLRDLGYYTGRDPRGLRPRPRPRARRRRPLRRADGPLRPAAAGRRLRALPGARAHRPGGGGADRGSERCSPTNHGARPGPAAPGAAAGRPVRADP